MGGYFGTEAQQRLQELADAHFTWAAETPGACNSARMLGTDDPDRLGWDHILERLREHGIFSFRLLTGEAAARVREKVEPLGFRYDTWNVFSAGREALPVARAVAAEGMPAGFRALPPPAGGEAAETRELQQFMADSGVAPFSGAMLAGELAPCVTIRIADAAGGLAASAYGYLSHNRHSPHSGNAWGGLVAVAQAHRGKRLGAIANAMMVAGCFEQLGATRVHEYVSADNAVSRRTVEASGLRLMPDLVGGAVTRGEQRFTR